jgi:ubiquinone/menaquinone biosynthesis C-methylase UbiE
MRRCLVLALSFLACARPEPPARDPPARAEPASPAARTPAPAMSYLGADWLTRSERVAEEQPDAMLDALRITPGMQVADIGAGVGYHALRIAPRVRPGGTVYATDLQPEMLAMLQTAVRDAGAGDIAAVLSSDRATGLPTARIDLAVMVDVYHELADPTAFMADLRRALAPNGRVALVEFRGEDPDVPIKEEHKMTVAQVDAELAVHGFTRVERHDFLPWQHILIYRVGAK